MRSGEEAGVLAVGRACVTVLAVKALRAARCAVLGESATPSLDGCAAATGRGPGKHARTQELAMRTRFGHAIANALQSVNCPPAAVKDAHQRWEDDVQAILDEVATKQDVAHAVALMQLELRNLTDRIVIRVSIAISAVLGFAGAVLALVSKYVL